MRSTFVGGFGLALLLGSVGQAAAAPTQWPANGHFYEVVSVPAGISWDAANAAAIARGGYLATITTQAENNFVFSLTNNASCWRGSSGPWLGGFQSPATSQANGNWQWVTGEPWGYTNWQVGQPNDSAGKDEDKLQFGFAARVPLWNDMMSIDPNPNYLPIAYVVESVPEPTTWVLLGAGASALAWRRRRSA